jgi:hypothetical protein
MQKWEYIVQQFQSPSELFTILNKLGDEGWELMTLLAEGTATHRQIVARTPVAYALRYLAFERRYALDMQPAHSITISGPEHIPLQDVSLVSFRALRLVLICIVLLLLLLGEQVSLYHSSIVTSGRCVPLHAAS